MADALVSAEQVLVTDYPLNEALNVLKGVNAFRPAMRAALQAALHKGALCSRHPLPPNATDLLWSKWLKRLNPA